MILLLGVQGQLGGALQRVVPPDTCCWGRRDLDLRQVKEIAPKIIAAQPKIVINTAAMTDVDACEREPAAARAVNGEAPGELARACIKIGAALVHVSTDYVFGRDEARNVPYVESDAPAPVNMYGTDFMNFDSRANQIMWWPGFVEKPWRVQLYTLKNTDRLLNSYLEIKSGKTGYLDEAGYCLVSNVRGPNGQEVLVAVLGSESEVSRFQEVKALAQWAYDNYIWPMK